MKPFSFHRPKTVLHALDLLAQYKESAGVVAGGTDMVIYMNEGERHPAHVIDISGLDELRYLHDDGGTVKIGALRTFTSLERDEFVARELAALHETASHVGSPQIRSLGTIGGNVVNASVAGDSPTVLEAYGAEVVLRSKAGERVMTVEQFNEGPGNCQIKPDELLTEIRFKRPSSDEAVAYSKIGRRKSLAIVVLAVSMYVKRGADGCVEDSRVILGAVSKHPMRAPTIEAALKGRRVEREALYETLPLFTDAIDAAIPTRASVVYKREGVRGAARLCFDQVLGRFGLA